jgi:AraC-like DNA-binding protein
MIYLEKNANTNQSNFVKCFWFSDSQEAEGVHTVLPDGYFDLIYCFQGEMHKRTFLTGTWTKPIDVPFTKHTRHFGVRFKLLASEYVFNIPIQSIIDTSLCLSPDYLTEELDVFASFDLFAAHMEKVVNAMIPESGSVDPRKFKLFQILYGCHGNIGVSELSERVGWSSRQINRWFNAWFGLPLKTFANILKCHAAYRNIAQGELNPVGDYYDQAHFIKEIKRFTGTTPKVLHENKNVRFLQLSTREKK